MRLAVLVALVLAGLAAAEPARASVEGFETGLGAWTPAGLWHRIVAPDCVAPHAGTACVYFGRSAQCDYDDHLVKDASFTSGPVSLTDPARAFISFWILYQVESSQPSCYDQLRLERSDDGVNWALLQKLSPPSDPAGASASVGMASGSGLGGTPLWQYQRVDLSAYLGLTIYLRFRFVSSGHLAGDGLCLYTDSDLDGFLGYALDDVNFADSPEPVSLLKSVSPPFGAPGSTLTYTLVARNRDSASQSLDVWDSLPTGTVFVSGAPAPTVLSAPLVGWSVPGVAAGASITLSLQVQATASAGQDLLNVAAGASPAPGLQAFSSPALFKVRNPGFSLRKSARPSTLTNGDEVTYAIVLENFSPLTQSALVLQEQPPAGFVLRGSDPSMGSNAQWPLSPMSPGDVRSFSLWGPVFGNDGQVLVNLVSLLQGGALAAQASASVTVLKPIEPQIMLKGVYPNPAPGSNPAFGEAVHIAYELNEAMPVTLDVYTIAGEKLRSLAADGTRGLHEAVWDLKNDWGYSVASGVYAFRLWSSTAVRPAPEAFGYVAVLK